MKLNHQHLHQGSLFPIFSALSSSLHRHPLLPTATFPPSIQPILGLPPYSPSAYFCHQHPPSHTVLINSLHLPKPSQYSLILSTRNSLYRPARLPTSSFLNTSSQEHSLSFSQHFSYPTSFSVQRRWCNYSNHRLRFKNLSQIKLGK